MIVRLALVGTLTLAACGDHEQRGQAGRSALELGIERDLTAKLAERVTASCKEVMGIKAACEAKLANGTRVPLAITSEGKEWAWRVAARVVETAPVVAYIDQSLADLKVSQRAECGGRYAIVEPGTRLACRLSGGGMAFVQFTVDNTLSLELALDAAAARARGEVVTPEGDAELTRISRVLEGLEGETDGEEDVLSPPSDGGAAKP